MRRPHHVEAALFWIFTGIIMVIAFGDVLTLLAIASGIVATAWWVSGKLEHREAENDAMTASVTDLRPALTDQRRPEKTHTRRGVPLTPRNLFGSQKHG